ncbi:MAG TPA: MBOAT family O-acyltransferase [Thermoanaerobaculia bacterium]|nr:MBOAT family O-acyltransferase [Thermoanaerobaculia bacterium]
MLFQTPEFLVFFVTVAAAVAIARGRGRKLVLLIASWIFYGWWSPRFLVPLLITTFADYAIGLLLDGARTSRPQSLAVSAGDHSATGRDARSLRTGRPRSGARALVAISVAGNLSMLALLRIEPGLVHMAVPLGISFYTFHSISYIVDVYRGELPACRSPLDYALFIAFFPELVAGPIVRGKQFLPQLAREVVVRIDEFAVMRVTRGLAKKVLIADNVAPFANAVFADPAQWPSIVIWTATIAFAVQIYCDFSGYTDIAIGLAHVFGFELPVNFDHPYLARDMRDFWRRWHISLSTWLRDYVYIPLGGREHRVRNVMITMLLGGLWHGTSWNFVLWGAMHGVLLCVMPSVVEAPGIAPAARAGPSTTLGMTLLTQLCILFTWIAFRVREPHAMLAAMRKFVLFDFDFALAGRGLLTIFFFSTIALIFVFAILHVRRFDPSRLRTPAFIAMCIGIGIAFFFLWPAEQTPFIYFQF